MWKTQGSSSALLHISEECVQYAWFSLEFSLASDHFSMSGNARVVCLIEFSVSCFDSHSILGDSDSTFGLQLPVFYIF